MGQGLIGCMGTGVDCWYHHNSWWKCSIFRNFVCHWHHVRSLKWAVVELFTPWDLARATTAWWRSLFLLETCRSLVSLPLVFCQLRFATSRPRRMCSVRQHCQNHPPSVHPASSYWVPPIFASRWRPASAWKKKHIFLNISRRFRGLWVFGTGSAALCQEGHLFLCSWRASEPTAVPCVRWRHSNNRVISCGCKELLWVGSSSQASVVRPKSPPNTQNKSKCPEWRASTR